MVTGTAPTQAAIGPGSRARGQLGVYGGLPRGSVLLALNAVLNDHWLGQKIQQIWATNGGNRGNRASIFCLRGGGGVLHARKQYVARLWTQNCRSLRAAKPAHGNRSASHSGTLAPPPKDHQTTKRDQPLPHHPHHSSVRYRACTNLSPCINRERVAFQFA